MSYTYLLLNDQGPVVNTIILFATRFLVMHVHLPTFSWWSPTTRQLSPVPAFGQIWQCSPASHIISVRQQYSTQEATMFGYNPSPVPLTTYVWVVMWLIIGGLSSIFYRCSGTCLEPAECGRIPLRTSVSSQMLPTSHIAKYIIRVPILHTSSILA